MRVAVVGAGLGGLAAACHLVGQRHDVVVLERGARPGGRAGLLAEAGYRLDTGPSVLTMADIVADTLAAAGTDPALLELVPLDPLYRATFAAGGDPERAGVIHVRRDREAMREEITAVAGSGEARSFDRFCTWLTALYRLEVPHFIDRNFDVPADLASSPGALLALVRSGALRRLSSVVSEYFADPRLQRLFSFQALYAGLSPLEALAVYGVITYMDTVAGVYLPRGGMHALPQALADAAGAGGAELRFEAPVARIRRRSGRGGAVTGVELASGEVVEVDCVVANPDLPLVYRLLLDGLAPPLVARRGEYSPSAAVWLVGARGPLPPGAAHHNIHFGEDWAPSFEALLREGVPMRDPSILVSVPSVTEPSLAPPGGHAYDFLEPVPNLDGRIDWAYQREWMRDRLEQRVRRLGYLEGATVEVESFTDPLDWLRQGMERGTPFSLSHRFFQTGPFRPANVDARVPGLVLVGSGTVPGVGVPMVLLSGRLAAERVAEWAAGRRPRPGRWRR